MLIDDVMKIGYKGTKSLRPFIGCHRIYELMAICYLLGSLGVLMRQQSDAHS